MRVVGGLLHYGREAKKDSRVTRECTGTVGYSRLRKRQKMEKKKSRGTCEDTGWATRF